ncbi:hypothetical protein DFJ74DRAFT_646082 [Hyaloraphidium curvatum]|nr:hypothetical protein DFJ74DRAFT_646082 [Hyaloraphidium curvatum]
MGLRMSLTTSPARLAWERAGQKITRLDPVDGLVASTEPSPVSKPGGPLLDSGPAAGDSASSSDSDNDDEVWIRDYLENSGGLGAEDLLSGAAFSAVLGFDASDDDEGSDSDGNDGAVGPSGPGQISKSAAKKLRKAERRSKLQAKRDRIQAMDTESRKIRNGLKQGTRDGGAGGKLHALLGPINSTLRSFVADPLQPEMGALPPMPAVLRRPALKLAAEYRVKTGTQGHGARKYTTLYRTQASAVPPDWNRLVEKVLAVDPTASEMSNTIPNVVSKADRRKKGSAGLRLNKDQARPAAKGYAIGEEVGADVAPISGGIGFKLMEKMGWSVGEGLGRPGEDGSSGILEPVTVRIMAKGRGLGHYDSGAQQDLS